MGEVIPLFKTSSSDEGSRGGDCPVCGKGDGFVNIERCHYGLCKTHGVYWFIGANLFSCWQDETYADWKVNFDILDKMRQVRDGPAPGLLPEQPDDPNDDPPFGCAA